MIDSVFNTLYFYMIDSVFKYSLFIYDRLCVEVIYITISLSMHFVCISLILFVFVHVLFYIRSTVFIVLYNMFV